MALRSGIRPAAGDVAAERREAMELRTAYSYEAMRPLPPRDIFLGCVAGGGIVAVVAVLVGVLDFVAAFNAGPNQRIFAFEGAVWIGVGGVFGLVAGIVLPAWRAIAIESASH
ncbi:MAG TPA: hypothetical protein VFG07_03635 [Thermoplasmata archaeon]|nr:hypothetical protein [Thermoplasmata archaeon]